MSSRPYNLSCLLLVLAVIATAVGATSGLAPVVPPTWPASFELEYTFSRSLATAYMPSGFKETVHIWQDGPGNRSRIDTYGGVGSYVIDGAQQREWHLFPKGNDLVCELAQAGRFDNDAQTFEILPNLSGWVFAGTATVRNTRTRVWQSSSPSTTGTKVQLFYTAVSNGRPVRYTTTWSGGAIIYDITIWRAGSVDGSVFNWPTQCVKAELQAFSASAAKTRLQHILPASHTSASAVAALLENAELVANHNAQYKDESCATGKGTTYKLALNQFAHIPADEFKKSHTGFIYKPLSMMKASKATAVDDPLSFKRIMADDELPSSLDYTGKGEDGPGVKDQMFCGGCYSFAAAGALTGAWFKATNQSISFSEQQILDCAWNYGISGCNGGNQYLSIAYIAAAGGAVQETDYPFLSENAYCATGIKKPTKVYANVSAPAPEGIPRVNGFLGPMVITPNDTKALMEALVRYGPVAVAIDSDPLQLYSEGVLYTETCAPGRFRLDHAVVLMGYGTTISGVDYWIIKNSWSRLWGEGGYARISREWNCGITTLPVVAVVDPKAAAEAVGAMKGLAWAKKTPVAAGSGGRRILK